MATGWLKGTVKAVPSGDSLLIMGSVKGGPPPEKTVTLAGLIAPKLVGVLVAPLICDGYRFLGSCGGDRRALHLLHSKDGVMLWMRPS